MTSFPLVRSLSRRMTPVFLHLPVTPNGITALSLVAGLACAWYMMQGDQASAVVGAVLLVAAYVLDNCDGEVARLRNQCSAFGERFDTLADMVIHTCFFGALGIGVSRNTGQDIWLWLGWIAAAGGAINFALGLLMRDPGRGGEATAVPADDQLPAMSPAVPRTWLDKGVFFLRELARADFCFIVLALAIFDAAWLLLPTGAVGA